MLPSSMGWIQYRNWISALSLPVSIFESECHCYLNTIMSKCWVMLHGSLLHKMLKCKKQLHVEVGCIVAGKFLKKNYKVLSWKMYWSRIPYFKGGGYWNLSKKWTIFAILSYSFKWNSDIWRLWISSFYSPGWSLMGIVYHISIDKEI
jgi:hypothetical protein